MKRARVLTSWIGDGKTIDTAYKPKISQDFKLISCTDVTEQSVINLPPEPNLAVVEIVCNNNVMSAIEANPDYTNGILWVEDI